MFSVPAALPHKNWLARYPKPVSHNSQPQFVRPSYPSFIQFNHALRYRLVQRFAQRLTADLQSTVNIFDHARELGYCLWFEELLRSLNDSPFSLRN